MKKTEVTLIYVSFPWEARPRKRDFRLEIGVPIASLPKILTTDPVPPHLYIDTFARGEGAATEYRFVFGTKMWHQLCIGPSEIEIEKEAEIWRIKIGGVRKLVPKDRERRLLSLFKGTIEERADGTFIVSWTHPTD